MGFIADMRDIADIVDAGDSVAENTTRKRRLI